MPENHIPEPTGDELLDQLVALVAGFGERLSMLEGTAGDGEREQQQFGQLVSIVEGLKARVDVLESQPWKVWPAPNPVLASWVEEWLIPTFKLDTTLAGWADTPAIMSELSALYAGYTMMTHPKATGWDALTWHQHRASTIERIEDFRTRHRSNPAATGNWGSHTTTA